VRPILPHVYALLPVRLQSLACTADGYRRALGSFTSYFHETLEAWEQRVEDPIEVHHERQWQGLVELIERAREHVPYYRFLPPIVEAGDPAMSIEKTLENIPPLEKAVYRARSRDFVSRDVPTRRLQQRSTSGTTGTALPVWHTPERIAEGHAAVWRQRRAFGVKVDDPVINFTGQVIVPLRQQSPPFWRRDYLSGMTLFSMYHLSPPNLPSYIEAMHESTATYVHGYPSVLHLVGRAMIEADRCLPAGQLRGVFTHSESVLAFQRETIERAFGTPVRDYYHSTEEAVSMTACSHGKLHVDMEYGIVEVEPVEETEEYVRGPLLVTGTGRGTVSTPFIRYRIGDVGTRLKGACPCGRPGDVFLDIDGRIEDYVATPDGRLVGRLDHIFKQQYEIEEAQVLQERDDAIEVLVVAGSGFGEKDRKNLEREVHARLGPGIRVDIRPVQSIPREPNGKFRAVKSSVAGIDS
jgi:phenylacetate-CoA ligase